MICKNKTAIGIYFKIFQVQKTSYNEPTTVVLTSRAFLNQPHRLIVPNFGLKMDGTGNLTNNIIISYSVYVIRILVQYLHVQFYNIQNNNFFMLLYCIIVLHSTLVWFFDIKEIRNA